MKTRQAKKDTRENSKSGTGEARHAGKHRKSETGEARNAEKSDTDED